jgi:hypothetical protein
MNAEVDDEEGDRVDERDYDGGKDEGKPAAAAVLKKD